MPTTGQSKKRPIAAGDLFRIAIVSDPHTSLDGRHVAWVQTQASEKEDLYRASIWIASSHGQGARQLTSGQSRDHTPRWSPDGLSIAFVSNRPGIFPCPKTDADDSGPDVKDKKLLNQVWTIRIDGGEAAQQTNHPNGADDPAWSPDGRTIAFVARDDVPKDSDLSAATSIGPIADERVVHDISYRFDGKGWLETHAHLWSTEVGRGISTQITFGESSDAEPAWSPDGSMIAFSSNRSPDRKRQWNRLSIHSLAVGSGIVTAATPDDAQFGSPVWSPDGSRVAFIGHLGTSSAEHNHIWTVSTTGENLTDHTGHADISFGDSGMSDLAMSSFQGPRWMDDRWLLALASESGQTQVYGIETGESNVHRATEGDHRIAGFAIVNDDLAIVRGTISRPFELELWSENRVKQSISHANDAFVDEVELVDAINLPVKSADDATIQTWLIPPVGFDDDSAAKYPLILQIHGGPHSMYGYGMFHEMQLMAAKGYAVVFSNPRGSAGYGQQFVACTTGIWGEADMPDVIAAVDAASALPWIDSDRLGITGGSYGGYLTNWTIGHDTRFKAAVTQRCVSNFYSFFGTSDIGSTFGVNEFDGLPWSDAEKLLRHSPISYVNAIDTPLLILHSENDFRCPIEQAEQLFASLKYLDRTVEFVRFPEEGHELSRSGTPSRRMARLHHLIGWFDRHL